MGLRQSLERHKAWLLPLFIVVVGGAVFYSVWSTAVVDDLGGPIDKAYYTTDGKTYFPDSLSRQCPFDHEGKPAYRAFVFRNKPSDPPFIAYLGRHVTDAKPTGVPGMAPPKVEKAASDVARAPDEVRKPDQTAWVPAASAEGMAIINSVVAGGQRPEPIMP